MIMPKPNITPEGGKTTIGLLALALIFVALASLFREKRLTRLEEAVTRQEGVIRGLVQTDEETVDRLKGLSAWLESNTMPYNFGTNRSFVVYGTNWQKQPVKFRLYLPEMTFTEKTILFPPGWEFGAAVAFLKPFFSCGVFVWTPGCLVRRARDGREFRCGVMRFNYWEQHQPLVLQDGMFECRLEPLPQELGDQQPTSERHND